MPQKWLLRLALEGDIRFVSHHDVMRAMERIVRRARLGLRYSQGYNPRPIMSLPCPRPVGVATGDDALVLSLEDEMDGDDLVRRLNAAAFIGMSFSAPRLLSGKKPPRPLSVQYELPLPQQKASQVQARLAELDSMPQWTIERLVSSGKTRQFQRRDIDLRPLIAEISSDARRLRWKAVIAGDIWARPGELLRLLGLDERTDLAATVRTAVEYETAL